MIKLVTFEFDLDHAGRPALVRVNDGTDTKYSANGTARQENREYRINLYQYADESTAVSISLNGRSMPENHKADMRAACLAAFTALIDQTERPPALEEPPAVIIVPALEEPPAVILSPALKSAYRYHRLKGRPALPALTAARQDLSNHKERYAGGPHGYGKPFVAYGSRHMRWIESPAYAGLRFVGYADEICKSIKHTGWYLDPDGDSSIRGAVYQMAGRNGRPRFVAGYNDPNIDGPACLAFDEVFTGEQTDYQYYTHDAAVDAARHADSIAESYAEKERDYQRAWQAGSKYYHLGESIKDNRSRALALFAERRAARIEAGNTYPAICQLIDSKIWSIWESIQENRAERQLLMDGMHSEYWFSDSERSGFNDGANL